MTQPQEPTLGAIIASSIIGVALLILTGVIILNAFTIVN